MVVIICLLLITFQVTNAPIVPPIILFLAKHPMVDKFDLTSVEEVTSGAAPMGKGLEEALIERMPKLKCVRQGNRSPPIIKRELNAVSKLVTKSPSSLGRRGGSFIPLVTRGVAPPSSLDTSASLLPLPLFHSVR